MEYTNDELEEKGLIEVCKHCGSPNITVEKDNQHFCNSCGIVDYVEYITEEQLEKINKITC
jgi:hypothetical protein